MEVTAAALDDFGAAVRSAEAAIADLSGRFPRVGSVLPEAIGIVCELLNQAKIRAPSQEALARGRCAFRAALLELQALADSFEGCGSELDQLLITAGRARATVDGACSCQ